MTYKYVSLFAGAGGLDIGLERAGLEAIAVNEIEPVFCQSLKANQGWSHCDGRTYLEGAKIVEADVRDLNGADLHGGRSRLDLLVGGPPCQAFSSSGKQLSVLDPRGALVSEYYRLVDELQPRTFIFENVRGLVTARDKSGEPGGVLRELVGILEEIGYSVRAQLLNSADFGAYQRRVRCFLIGSKNGLAPEAPKPTHSRKGDLLTDSWQSLRDFLSTHSDDDDRHHVLPTPALAQALKDIPNGSGLKSPGRAEATRPGGHWGYRQGTFVADLDLPARTVTGTTSQDWVRWNGKLRRLTLLEVLKLQGFPSDWVLSGSKSQQFKQVGNAVPTTFGELLGHAITAHLDDYPRTSAVRIPLHPRLVGAIEYTKRDHARNSASRSVHKNFG